MGFRWRRFLLQRKKARKAIARTATGTATAGAIIEALELELGVEDAAEVEEGLDVDTGAAMMLGEEVVRVEETPLDWVIIEVTRIMLVESSGVLLFWSTEVLVLVDVSEVELSGEAVVSGEEVDVAVELIGEIVKTDAAESEKVGLGVVVEGSVEVEDVDVVEVEMAEDMTEDITVLEGPLPTDENTTPLLSEKRALEVLQHPRLLSPSASGRLASQQ